jgi:hypothetical protein
MFALEILAITAAVIAAFCTVIWCIVRPWQIIATVRVGNGPTVRTVSRHKRTHQWRCSCSIKDPFVCWHLYNTWVGPDDAEVQLTRAGEALQLQGHWAMHALRGPPTATLPLSGTDPQNATARWHSLMDTIADHPYNPNNMDVL